MTPDSIADIVRQLLLDLGYTDSGWPIYVSFLPDEQDQAVCVYDTAGELDGRVMGTGEKIEHPGVMIRLRGTSYPETWNKAYQITQSLDGVWRQLVAMSSDDVYMILNVSRRGAILPLGLELEGSRRRYDFTINAVLTVNKQ